MKNTVTPAVRLTSESIMRSFLISGKKHLFIAGGRENGRAKLEAELIQLMGSRDHISVLQGQDAVSLAGLSSRQDVFLYDMDHPVLPTGCVILASGLSRRFGSNKLLADFRGKPLISHILDKTGGPPFDCRLSVTRHETVASLCRSKGFPYLLHSLPLRSDTVRLGLGYLLEQNPGLKGCLFCPGDQPLVSTESIETLVLTFSHFPDRILRLSINGRPGSPVLFGRRFFPELLNLPEGKGGSFPAQKYPEQVLCIPARDPYELSDADTPEDLARLAAIR